MPIFWEEMEGGCEEASSDKEKMKESLVRANKKPSLLLLVSGASRVSCEAKWNELGRE